MCFWPQILPHSNVLALTSVIPKRDVNTQYHQKAQLFHIYTVVTENIHLFSLVQQLRLSQKKNLPKQTNSDPTHSAHHMYQRSHSPNILLEAEISRQRSDDPQLACMVYVIGTSQIKLCFSCDDDDDDDTLCNGIEIAYSDVLAC